MTDSEFQDATLAALSDSETLRHKVAPLLSVQARDVVEEAAMDREYFIIRMDEMMHELAKKVSLLNELKSRLSIEKKKQKVDIKRLTDHKWALIAEAKNLRV